MDYLTDTIEQALYKYLVADAGVAEQIGTRLYPMTIPQEAERPAAAYQVISQTEIMDHDGYSKLTTCRVQLTCQADSYGAVKVLARTLEQALRGYRGKMGDIQVDGGEILNEFDGYGSVGGVYTTRVDVGLMYR